MCSVISRVNIEDRRRELAILNWLFKCFKAFDKFEDSYLSEHWISIKPAMQLNLLSQKIPK